MPALSGVNPERSWVRYPLSYRDLEERIAERGVQVVSYGASRSKLIPRSIALVLKSAPELDKRIRSFLNPTNASWRVDETDIEVKGEWKYLYQAVDSEGNTLDFMLSAKRDAKAAARFLHQVLGAKHTQGPWVITIDKNAAYPVAIDELKQNQTLAAETELRQSKYLNNIIEQDHWNIKRIVKPMMGFQALHNGFMKSGKKRCSVRSAARLISVKTANKTVNKITFASSADGELDELETFVGSEKTKSGSRRRLTTSCKGS
jgi:transposase-like protein